MNTLEAIHTRRAVRKFLNKPVEKTKLSQILDAAHWAPSAGNLQDWKFIVVTEKAKREALEKAALKQTWILQAPILIVVCGEPNIQEKFYGDRGEMYSIQGCAAATQNILLAAHELGLATGWVGAFDEGEVKDILKLPGHIKPYAIIPLGYPAEKPLSHRYKLDTCVYFEEYGWYKHEKENKTFPLIKPKEVSEEKKEFKKFKPEPKLNVLVKKIKAKVKERREKKAKK